ncbi:W2 domain-containing protein, partial [Blyttiomyces helicus]
TEIGLLVKVQQSCYEDARFMKHFRTIVSNLYKHDVVSESAIIYWNEKGAGTQGKTVFLKQMEPFVAWLKEQEDDDSDEEEEDEE